MAYDLNWSMLGAPVNVGAAVNAGYERGRDLRLRGAQESAFALLARDPNSAEGRALLVESGRPDLARQFHTWGREDRRDAYGRAAFGGGAMPSAFAPAAVPTASGVPPPAPSAFNASPAQPGTAPGAISAPPGIVPPAASTAPPAASTAPGQLNPQMLRQFFAEDPAGARELLTTWNALNAAQRAEQTRRFTAAVPILAEVARMPLAERGQAVMGQADFLVQNGWTAEQIQQFAADPNDQRIRMLLRIGVPIAEQRQFFAPIEGGAGQVYRDPVTLGVDAANPAPPRSETYYDASGNEFIRTVPGTPAIGPDANLFGTVAPDQRPTGGPAAVGGPAPTGGVPNAPAREPVNIRQAAALGRSYGTVTSTVRTPEHNAEVGGARNSNHLARQGGRAVDIVRRRGVTHAEIVRGYQAAGYTLDPDTRDEGDHSHIVIASMGGSRAPVSVRTIQEARALPPGTSYTTPDGQRMIR